MVGDSSIGHINKVEFKERERELIARKEKQNANREVSAIDDMTNHLQELAKIKQMAEGQDIPYGSIWLLYDCINDLIKISLYC